MLLSYSMVLFHPAIRIWKASTAFLSAYSMCSFSWSVTPISPLQLNENAQKEINYEPLLQNGVDVCCPVPHEVQILYPSPVDRDTSLQVQVSGILFTKFLLSLGYYGHIAWTHSKYHWTACSMPLSRSIKRLYVRYCLHANVLMITLLKQRNSTVTHLFSDKINRVGEINYGWSGDFKHTYCFLPNVLI